MSDDSSIGDLVAAELSDAVATDEVAEEVGRQLGARVGRELGSNVGAAIEAAIVEGLREGRSLGEVLADAKSRIVESVRDVLTDRELLEALSTAIREIATEEAVGQLTDAAKSTVETASDAAAGASETASDAAGSAADTAEGAAEAATDAIGTAEEAGESAEESAEDAAESAEAEESVEEGEALLPDDAASLREETFRELLEVMSYRELQSVAKGVGVKANLEREEMTDRIVEEFTGDE